LDEEPPTRRQSPNDGNFAEMVRRITQMGPEMVEIAKILKVHKETVRYRYKQLLARGFTVQASRNHEKLGMKRVVAIVELNEQFEGYADTLFYAMGEVAYIAGFAKTLPEAYYVLNASVPTECLDSWLEFMLSLKAMGVFKSIESVTLDWVRNVPMWAEHFNFETGTWEFDWTSKRVNPNAHEVPAMERSRYDSIDLAIIAQLQLDANTSVKQMASKSGVNYKTLSYHYRSHVLARGLIAGYIINWTGNRYDAKAEKILTKKHRYLFVNLIANGLSAGERAGLMEKVNRTPFVLLEGSSTRAYFAQMAFPSEEVTDALEFLQGVVGPIRSKVKWFHMDQSHSLRFSLPRSSYNEREQRWTFNKEELTGRFGELVQKIREGMT